MIKVSTTGMAVSLKTDLRFPESGQHGHGSRIIQLPTRLHIFQSTCINYLNSKGGILYDPINFLFFYPTGLACDTFRRRKHTLNFMFSITMPIIILQYTERKNSPLYFQKNWTYLVLQLDSRPLYTRFRHY